MMLDVDGIFPHRSLISNVAGSRREDDWTCPSCGNVNFSFRTTCNMRNCTQPRPAEHNSVRDWPHVFNTVIIFYHRSYLLNERI